MKHLVYNLSTKQFTDLSEGELKLGSIVELNRSLDHLPEEIISFVDSVTNYCTNPENKKIDNSRSKCTNISTVFVIGHPDYLYVEGTSLNGRLDHAWVYKDGINFDLKYYIVKSTNFGKEFMVKTILRSNSEIVVNRFKQLDYSNSKGLEDRSLDFVFNDNDIAIHH